MGIIGVVAALTLPTVINRVQEVVLDSQAKKARTMVANGYKLMMARDDIFKVENIQFLQNCNQMSDVRCVANIHKENFSVMSDITNILDAQEMPSEYAIKGKPRPSPFRWISPDVKYMFMTPDGMVFGVIPAEDFKSFDVVVDVNGKNNPNIAARDLRKFRFANEGGQTYDVSNELEQLAGCSLDNPDECTTQEQCNSLPYGQECANGHWDHYWDGNQCQVYCRT